MRKSVICILVLLFVLSFFSFWDGLGTAYASGLSYHVRPGDTFWLLSQRFDVSTVQIKSASNYWQDNLMVGQRLVIPVSGGNTAGGKTIYTVQRGDSLWAISNRYGTNVNTLMSLNNLSSSVINIGDILVISQSNQTPDDTSYTQHTVRSGDTLWRLSQQYGTTVNAIMSLNNLQSSYLRIGQVLKIPGTSTPSDPSPSNPRVSLSASEMRTLAQMIEAEAGGEPVLGQVAVGAVIINRIKSPQFPNTLHGVLYEHRQFESILNGWFYQVTGDRSLDAARRAVSGEDPSKGSLYFFNPAGVPSNSWMWTREILVEIGGHVFGI